MHLPGTECDTRRVDTGRENTRLAQALFGKTGAGRTATCRPRRLLRVCGGRALPVGEGRNTLGVHFAPLEFKSNMRTLRAWHILLLSTVWPVMPLLAAETASRLPAAPDRQLERASWILGYQQMDAAGKQRALQHLLLERNKRAAALVLSDAQIGKLAADHAEILRRVQAGKKLSTAGLQSLWDQTDALEKQAIERLARRYVIVMYTALKNDPRAVAQRAEAWRRVYYDWHAAGGRAEQQPLLIDWLSSAVRRFQRGQFAHLPPRPVFADPGSDGGRALMAGKRPSVSLPVLGALSLPVRSRPPVAELPAARRATEAAAAEPAFAPAIEFRPQTFVAKKPERLTLVRTAQERAAERLPGWQADLAAVVHAVNRPLSIPALPTPPAAVASALPAPPPAVAAREAREAPRPPRRTPASVAGYIDLAELRDRLSGYKVAVADLNGRLHDARLLDVAGLTELVDTFEELVMRRGDLNLYLRLVAEEGASLPTLESAQPTISLLSGKISAARLRIERQQDEEQLPRQHAELATLDQLSRRVAVLAIELEQQK